MKNKIFIKKSLLLTLVLMMNTFLLSCNTSDSSGSKPAKVGTPNNVRFSAVTRDQVIISWEKAENANYYDVYRHSTDNHSAASIMNKTSILNEKYTDNSSLTEGSTYYYWVKACGAGDNNCVLSAMATVRIPSLPLSAFSRLNNLRASAVSTDRVTLAWETLSTATRYLVYRNDSPSTSGLSAIATPTVGSYTDHGLQEGNTYYYWVRACTDSACSVYSDSTSIQTLITPTPPNIRLRENSTVSTARVVVTWGGGRDTDYHEIYRSTNTKSTGGWPIASPLASAGSTYTDTVTTNTVYYYWIKACKTSLCSPFSSTASIKTAPRMALNDSGMTWGGDYPSGSNRGDDCSLEDNGDADGLPGLKQDCHMGRDAEAATALVKTGRGQAGFDFTKLGFTGIPLRIQDQEWISTGSEVAGTKWSCVRDNHTGLVWEVKMSSATHLHSNGKTYRWGGKTASGYAQRKLFNDQVAPYRVKFYNDDWDELVDGSNNERLCGFSDWRVPTIIELQSIVNYGLEEQSIDSHYFPNTRVPSSVFVQFRDYWSSTHMARTLSAFTIGFEDNGRVMKENHSKVLHFQKGRFKESRKSVRLVR